MADVHDHDDPVSTQVLTNADLLHCIFAFVPLPSDSHLDSYMARCAVVCRVFHEPAIRILWRNLSLLPLWHLLAPPNTLFPGPKGGNDRLLSYLQAINSAQLYLDPTRWDRFQWHATHVRRVSHATFNIPQKTAIHDAHSRLIQSVIVHNGGNTVLPLLRAIEWRGRSPGDDILIPFFTSTLRDAEIDFRGLDEAKHVSLLRRLCDDSPFLERIVLFMIDMAGHNLATASSSQIILELLNFPRLRWIQVSKVSSLEAFQALVTMPTLMGLIITTLEVARPWVGVGRTVAARGLQQLSVTGDVSALSGLFNGTRFPALKSAAIHLNSLYNVPVTLADLVDFLSLFYNAVSDSGLRSLHLAIVFRQFLASGSWSDLPALRDLVAPILLTRYLHTFSLISSTPVMTVDDADVEALASAWPNLECLVIDRGPSPESSVSFHALHYLHIHCPRLLELSITRLRWPFIGVHVLPGAPPGIKGSRLLVPSHPLRRLTVQFESLPGTVTKESLGPGLSDEDVEAMARYLLNLFPRLEPEQYKHAAQPEDGFSSASGINMEWIPGFDGRWRRVSARVYALCRARDGF